MRILGAHEYDALNREVAISVFLPSFRRLVACPEIECPGTLGALVWAHLCVSWALSGYSTSKNNLLMGIHFVHGVTQTSNAHREAYLTGMMQHSRITYVRYAIQ